MKDLKIWLFLVLVTFTSPAMASHSLGLLKKNIIIDARNVTPELERGLAHRTDRCRYVLLDKEAFLDVKLSDVNYGNVFVLKGAAFSSFLNCLQQCDTVSDVRLAGYIFNKFVVDYAQQHSENRYSSLEGPIFEIILKINNKKVDHYGNVTQVIDESPSKYTSSTENTKTFTYDPDEEGEKAYVDVVQSDTTAFEVVDDCYGLLKGNWVDLSDRVNYQRFKLKIDDSGIWGIIGIEEGSISFNYNLEWRDKILNWVKNEEWKTIEDTVIKVEITNPIKTTQLYDRYNNLIGNYREWLQSHQANHDQMSNLVSDTGDAESSSTDGKDESTNLERILGGILIFYILYKVFYHKETEEEKKKRLEREKRKKREREEEDRQRRDEKRRYAEMEYEDYLRQQKEQRWD